MNPTVKVLQAKKDGSYYVQSMVQGDLQLPTEFGDKKWIPAADFRGLLDAIECALQMYSRTEYRNEGAKRTSEKEAMHEASEFWQILITETSQHRLVQPMFRVGLEAVGWQEDSIRVPLGNSKRLESAIEEAFRTAASGKSKSPKAKRIMASRQA